MELLFETTGRALDRIRRHTIEEIAAATQTPPFHLESVMLEDQHVGDLLLLRFCYDQQVTPEQVKKYE